MDWVEQGVQRGPSANANRSVNDRSRKKEGAHQMLSFWIPGIEPAWLMALFATGFAVAGVIASVAALSRRTEEPDAAIAALLYGSGLGILAVSELVSMADVAWGWSLAAFFGVAGTAVTVVAAVATGVAILFIVAAVAIEFREEQVYRQHQHAHA
jgi:hypothetical protein